MVNKIKSLCRLPVFGPRTLLLSFEFGLILSETAKAKGITINSEISERAEQILLSELRLNGFRKTALNFTPLILACLEK
jgi:hypothetical protein